MMNVKNKKNVIISMIMGLYLAITTSTLDADCNSIVLFFLKIILFSFLNKKLFDYIDKKDILGSSEMFTKKDYICFFVFIFIVMLFALYMYYPTNFTIDMNTQYKQAITGVYNDWHPIMHTFFFYKLPTLFISSKLMCSIFQMLFVSVILLYFCYTLSKWKINKKIILITLILFIFNTEFDLMAISPLKDTAFSYCLFLMSLFLLNIYFSKGEWLNKRVNFFIFLAVSFGVSFFRHNGIFTFLVTLICMIIVLKNIRKKSIYIFLIIISLRFIFVPFIYKINNVRKIQITFSELACVMLNQISYIYNNDGNITKTQLEELKNYQDLNDLRIYYDPYNYNYYKFNTEFYDWQSYNINRNKKKIVLLWKNIVNNNKYMALESYLYTTYCIWHIDIDVEKNNTDLYWVVFKEKNNGISIYDFFQRGYFSYKKRLCKFPFSIFNITITSGLFLIIFSLVYCLKNSKSKIKILIPFIPVISNTLLFFLILPGRDTRFLYSNILCAFPFVIIMFLLKKKKKEEKV